MPHSRPTNRPTRSIWVVESTRTIKERTGCCLVSRAYVPTHLHRNRANDVHTSSTSRLVVVEVRRSMKLMRLVGQQYRLSRPLQLVRATTITFHSMATRTLPRPPLRLPSVPHPMPFNPNAYVVTHYNSPSHHTTPPHHTTPQSLNRSRWLIAVNEPLTMSL
jgi:hypothetical protein